MGEFDPNCPVEPNYPNVPSDSGYVIISDEGSTTANFDTTLNSISVQPDVTNSQSENYITKNVIFEAGYEQVWTKFELKRNEYELRFTNLKKTEKETIEAFFDARKNSLDAFSWTPPDTIQTLSPITQAFSSQSKKVHIKDNLIQYEKVDIDSYNIFVIFEEIF